MTTTSFSLACGDHSFPLLTIDQTVRLIADLGFTHADVALMATSPHWRPQELAGDLPRASAAIRATLDAAGLRMGDLFVVPGVGFADQAPNHPDEDERESSRALFDRMVELAALTGASGLTMVPGVIWSAPEADLVRAADELQRRALRARDRDVRFSIEAHVGSVAETPQRAAELLERAPDLELTLDYSHFVSLGFPAADVHPLLERTRHVHARHARSGRVQCGWGTSDLDYRDILQRLVSVGYDGALTVEYIWADWLGMNAVDVVSETVVLKAALEAWMTGATWEPPAHAARGAHSA